jgi:hypothetical protein
MQSLFAWIESTPLSIWTRESTSVWAFPGILAAHAIGMGLAAGVSVAIALRLFGVVAGGPVAEMRRFAPVLWSGFALNTASGILLLIAYPTKALTNPVFYLKLALIALAMAIFVAIERQLLQEGAPASRWPPKTWRLLAALSLASWAGAITAGRLLAYTYRHLLAGF